MRMVGVLCIFGFFGPLSAQDFLVIVSADTPLKALEPFQLKQIYLGKLDRLDGVKLTPIQLKEDDPLRAKFDRRVFGERFDLDNYWLNMRLSARAEPPLTVGGWALMLAFVERNPGYIGYVDRRVAALKNYKVKIIPIRWQP